MQACRVSPWAGKRAVKEQILETVGIYYEFDHYVVRLDHERTVPFIFMHCKSLLISMYKYHLEINFIFVHVQSTRYEQSLLYINSQSRFFLVFYWSRAYHGRVTKLSCLTRNSARGRQYVIDRICDPWRCLKARDLLAI